MKKAFTLIELLGIILVLGLILIFTVPAIMNSIKNSGNKEYENFLNTISMAAETYYQNNTEICDFEKETVCYFDVQKIIESGFAEETLLNPKTGKTLQSSDMIVLTKQNDGTINYSFSSVDEYTSQGLLVHYDAINNTKKGHNNNTNIWEDISGNNNDATLNNFDITNAWKNNALTFSGNKYGSTSSEYVNFNLGTQDATEFTITLFTKQGDWSVNEDRYQRLFYSRNSDNSAVDQFGIYPSYQSNAYAGYIEFYGSASSKFIPSYSFGTLEKYGLSVTCSNNTKFKVYKNGVLKKEFDIAESTYAEVSHITCSKILNYSMLLGNLSGNNRPYKGEIYNFKIYDKVLTNDEIIKNYEIDNLRYNNQN